MSLNYFVKRNRFQKVVIVFLITLLIALPSGQVGVIKVSAATEGDYEYEENKDEDGAPDGTATITGYIGESKDIKIPNIIGEDEHTVTTIGVRAFSGKGLESAIIPDTVKIINNEAFYNNELTKVNIPDGIEIINFGTFGSNKLTEVKIPASVIKISASSFKSNKLTDVTIPNYVTEIGNHAFRENDLVNITIPGKVTKIGVNAFSDNNLTDITISDSVESIGYRAFEGNNLTSVTIPDSVTEIGSWAFQDNELTTVILSKSLNEINQSVFRNNNLTNIDIPNSVTSIGYGAFMNNNLESVVIPDEVTSIGNSAFEGNQLRNIKIPVTVITIFSDAFKNNPDIAIIAEEDSEAYKYATDNELPFLNNNKPFYFKFEPNGSGDDWVQSASPNVTVYSIEELDELKSLWSNEPAESSSAGNWATFTNGTEIPKNDDGEWYLHIYAKDKIGNDKYVRSDPFQVDSTSPEIDITMTQGQDNDDYIGDTWTNEIVQVHVEAKDIHSGMANLTVTVDGESVGEIDEEGFLRNFFEDGTYNLGVNAVDKAGNKTTLKRTIKIDKTGPSEPLIQLEPEGWTNTEKVVTITEGKEEENGSGISHTEYRIGKDGDWETYDEPFDIHNEGETIIRVRTIDNVGNESATSKSIVQIDKTPPKLTLRGNNPINLLYGELFTEPNYDVSDNLDANIQNKVVIEGEVDTAKVGTYKLIYNAKDHAGNETIVTRMVHVNDEEQPVITLNGDNPLTLEVGTNYEEPGATAVDNADGNISDKITIRGEVDTNKPGTYYVYYNVNDESGNKAFEAVREVRIVAPKIIELELDKQAIPVYASSKVKIKNTHTSLILPDDLPEGTTLQVNSIENLLIKGYEQAGEMYDFVLNLPEGYENYKGEFVLTLGINNSKEKKAIYYYNESSQELEYIGGEIADGKITGLVDHFSIYGVFKQIEENPPVEKITNGINDANKSAGNTQKIRENAIPKTATNNYNIITVGLVFVLFGVISYFFIRRKSL